MQVVYIGIIQHKYDTGTGGGGGRGGTGSVVVATGTAGTGGGGGGGGAGCAVVVSIFFVVGKQHGTNCAEGRQHPVKKICGATLKQLLNIYIIFFN